MVRGSMVAALLVLFVGSSAAAAPSHPTVIDYEPIIVAGDPFGSPADSPTLRVDPNLTSSPYGGVGSVFMDAFGGSGFIGSATLIDPYHVITAGHCVDIDGNGDADLAPELVTFFLNYGSDYSHAVPAAAIDVHPDYTGFANPFVNDDIAVLTLSTPIFNVPYYPLNRQAIAAGTTITAVGYGRSGNGVEGFTTGASFSIKRTGQNQIDFFDADDEGSGANEVFYIDFDDPSGGPGYSGGGTLGNNIETTFGGGDSGGPSFVEVNGQLRLSGVNTFIGSFGGPDAPLFNSAAGGILIEGSLEWLDSVIPIPGDANGDRIVSGADYTIWADSFGDFTGDAQFADGDFNYDGFVTGADYTIWADYFGEGTGPVMLSVPEPSYAAALFVSLLGAGLGLRRLRR